MTEIHILAAVLASWRLTQVVTEDRIFEPIKRRLNWQVFNCGRCVSVWCGAVSLLALLTEPYINWPFALSMTFGLYGAAVNFLNGILDQQTPKVVIRPSASGINMELVHVSQDQARGAITALARSFGPPMKGSK